MPCAHRTRSLRHPERTGTRQVMFFDGPARFTLRGRPNVDGQWKLYCLVHNIEKLARAGYAA